MLRILMTVLLLAAVASLAGCQTMNRDPEQQVYKYSRISKLNRRMLAEDIDHILMLNHPSRLTSWHVRPD